MAGTPPALATQRRDFRSGSLFVKAITLRRKIFDRIGRSRRPVYVDGCRLMARFYGIVSGQARTQATRLGSPRSGLRAECRGWDIGVSCFAAVEHDDSDSIQVYLNGGSNGSGLSHFIGTARHGTARHGTA